MASSVKGFTIERSELNTYLYGTLTFLRPAGPKDAPLIRKWHNDRDLMMLARVGEKRTTLRQEKEET